MSSAPAAHALQYAPAPSLDVLGADYGRQPVYCKGHGDIWSEADQKFRNGSLCHGPHLYEEWWVGPRSGDALDTPGWRRPFRRTRAAPHDAWLMAPPVAVRDELVWVGSTGRVYTLPAYRVAGLYAPANGEVSTPNFTVPSSEPLWINAAAKWAGREVTGGCDEGCAAYVFAAVLDAATGEEIPGFGVKQAMPMKDVDGLRLPLRWKKGASGSADGAADGAAPAPPAQHRQQHASRRAGRPAADLLSRRHRLCGGERGALALLASCS